MFAKFLFPAPVCYPGNMSKVADTVVILREVRALSRQINGLRRDIELVIPSESITEYSNPKRILDSYNRAVKKFPSRGA